MAPQLTYFAENAEGISVGSASFNTAGGGRATALLYLLGANYDDGIVPPGDVIAAISQIVGGVNPSLMQQGRINRSLPLAHPLFPWLYATSVAMRGIGGPYKAIGQIPLEAAALPAYTGYQNYEFTVEFIPRQYVVAADASVPIIFPTFYDGSGTQVTATVAAEWVRYTNFWYDRKFESITARQGQMKFRIHNGSGAPVDCSNVPYADMPKIFLPDSLLHVVWQQVPYRFITSPNSYIDGLLGYINQNAFTTWQPGELLYVGYTAKPYTPPVQTLDPIYTGTTGYIFSTEKLADVELLFLRTKRKIGSASELYNSPAPGTVGLASYIQAGWNLLPWVGDRLYHYATTEQRSPAGNSDTDMTQWRPLFQSAEFSLLFSDPDCPGAYPLNLPN